MRGLIFVLILVFLGTLFSCSPKRSESLYFDEVGWQVTTPEGWKVLSEEEVIKINDMGAKLIQDTFEMDEIDMDNNKVLLALKKNMFNMVMATIEPFNLEIDGDWYENFEQVQNVMVETLEMPGVQVDISETITQSFGGVDFQTYSLSLKGPNNKALLNQITFGTLINGYDFSISVTYNSDENKQEIITMLEQSKFMK